MVIHEWIRARSPYHDVPHENLPVQIFVTRPRFKCRICEITRTPVIQGLEEKHRVTCELKRFLPSALLSSTSLRGLAKSVGMSPASLRRLLKQIAQEAQSNVLVPSKIGIHEFRVGGRFHLLLSNLEIGSVVEFFAAGESQLISLASFFRSIENKTAAFEITLPANIKILKAVFEGRADFNCYCSLTSVCEMLGRLLSVAAQQESRKGRPGSISSRAAHEIGLLHLHELSLEQNQRYLKGLQILDPFWMSFIAKEELIEAIHKNTSITLFEVVTTWYKNLPVTQQAIFGPFVAKITEIREFNLLISSNLIGIQIDENLKILEKIFIRPGVRMSDEMISALLLAVHWLRVPIQSEFGYKGTGQLWLEDELSKEHLGEPSHAGIHIESLVRLLLATRR